jgi:hypothetical protein
MYNAVYMVFHMNESVVANRSSNNYILLLIGLVALKLSFVLQLHYLPVIICTGLQKYYFELSVRNLNAFSVCFLYRL